MDSLKRFCSYQQGILSRIIFKKIVDIEYFNRFLASVELLLLSITLSRFRCFYTLC